MLKQITLFFNTGFNSINFPADPQTLYLFENKEYPAMDLVQENFLSALKIKATEEDIIDADYLRIGDAYYSIEGYVMTSIDVVAFSVTQNAILSVGGFPKLEFISGEVYRTTAIDDITMDLFDYNIQDELLTITERRPTRKFKAYSKPDLVGPSVSYENKWYGNILSWVADNPGEKYNLDIYTSTYDDQVPEKPSDIEVEELLGEAGAAAWETLQTAWIDPKKFETSISMHGGDISHGTELQFDMPGVAMYTGYNILNAAMVMNGFGVTNFIIDSYIVPRDFVDVTMTEGHIYELKGKYNRAYIGLGANYEEVLDPDRKMRKLNNKIREVIANQAIEVTIESMLTGENNTLPLSEVDVDINHTNGYRRIQVDMIADPSPNGCPYYKLVVKDKYGLSTAHEGNTVDTLLGSIRGATWMSNPLLFERTGFTRDLANAKLNQAYRKTIFDNQKDYNRSMYFNNLVGSAVNVASMGLIGGNQERLNGLQSMVDTQYEASKYGPGSNQTWYRNQSNAISAQGARFKAGVEVAGIAVNAGLDYHAMFSKEKLDHANMKAQYAAEILQLGLSHPGRELELRFPISDNGQLLMGNGVMVNVKSISNTDLDRYIRALQLYGIACNEKMDIGFITRNGNEPYNYIQAHGVSVKPYDDRSPKRKINKQLLQAISDMFAVGFRVWYEKPTKDAYKKMYVEEEQ